MHPMPTGKTLLVIPTYNEAGNIVRLLEEVHAQGLPLEILVIDDASPDGTAALVQELAPRIPVRVIRRAGKLGIGSAHKLGIRQAIAGGYAHLMTMDGDFAHDPAYLRTMLASAGAADVVLGSRYLPGGGLEGWSAVRRLITHTAHALTTRLLRLPYDCTGAFRLYNVARLRTIEYQAIRSDGYAFMIEMLYTLQHHGFTVHEIPIVLPSRHSGVSKISRAEILHAIQTLWRLGRHGTQPATAPAHGADSDHDREWDAYWTHARAARQGPYQVIAEFYRNQIISRAAAPILHQYLPDLPERQYLHAGCGSGGSDQRWALQHATIHALDFSLVALQMNRARRLPFPQVHVGGDLFRLPYRSQSLDGIFNFGVMEHFDEEQIRQILAEFHRVLKPGGRIVIFWPPEFGLSVLALKAFVAAASLVRKATPELHPAEISRVQSFGWVRALLARNRFRVLRVRFDWRDAFTYVVVVADATDAPAGAARPGPAEAVVEVQR
jgi:dolichol-phosphate mannosyltransferase